MVSQTAKQELDSAREGKREGGGVGVMDGGVGRGG